MWGLACFGAGGSTEFQRLLPVGLALALLLLLLLLLLLGLPCCLLPWELALLLSEGEIKSSSASLPPCHPS